ncbi:hypothetical protein HA402_004424 [Bradysia odoriphaga]|nr:hypothetical protein HA402_004424 [Bradysia odoriphaga]
MSDLTQPIVASIQKINQNVSSIQRLVGQTGSKQELDRLRTDTEKLFKDTEGMLDNLIFSNDDRRLKSQKNRLLDELVEAKTIWLKLRRRVDDDDD